MSGIEDKDLALASMTPRLDDGSFVFCHTTNGQLAAKALSDARGLFTEAGGVSLILPVDKAEGHGFDVDLPMRMISLGIHTALDAVGITAALSGALAAAGIPCNVVAAFHEDHLFVPEDRAEEAVRVLERVQDAAL